MGETIFDVPVVPYHSQWASPRLVEDIVTGRIPASEDPQWASYGAADPDEYAWWSWRLCGVACLRMALEYFGHTAPPAMEIARACVEAGAYVRHDEGLHGLIYAPFATWAEARFGIEAEVRPRLTEPELRTALEGGRLVMLSVHPSIREPATEPPGTGGHLVLAVGATDRALVLHNPSGFFGRSQEYAHVPWDRLGTFTAWRGVVLGPGR
ncbi:hypothetical protein GTW43_21785 [Streptomyces sp. SID5785]|uniref:C39 family peptidase n=1 Tax=Streptomyces sp. SID5785 TaxID=2690309 RepID=UPI001360D3FC|nr:C39 family peptidase [Streptomyces sp. SID5785]MZD07692.1 hypothetical protein [Streptomyces sp. SID5785]